MAQFHWAAVRRLFAPALSRATKLQLLRGVPILSGVPEHALHQLMGVMQLRLVGKLRRLVKPYEPPKNFTLLICGGAEARDLDGQNFVTLAAGDSFGLEALGAGDSGTIILPSTRSVTTLSAVLLLQLPAYAAEACRQRFRQQMWTGSTGKQARKRSQVHAFMLPGSGL